MSELVEYDQHPADINQAVDDQVANVPPISVTLSDAARVVILPTRSGGMRTYDLSLTVPTRILDDDPRRRRAVVQLSDTLGLSDGARFGPTQASVTAEQNSFTFALPGVNIAGGNVATDPLEITATQELWALAVVAACRCSVINEQWAD